MYSEWVGGMVALPVGECDCNTMAWPLLRAMVVRRQLVPLLVKRAVVDCIYINNIWSRVLEGHNRLRGSRNADGSRCSGHGGIAGLVSREYGLLWKCKFYSPIVQFLTKRLNLCLEQHALQTPFIDEELHELNKPI